MNIPLSPIRFLRYAREQFPEREAVVCDEYRFTYAQCAERAGRLAGALRQAGAGPGDRIAFLSTNCHRLLEAYYGVLEAECVLLPLNVRLAPADLAFILKDSGAHMLFAESRFQRLLDALRGVVAGEVVLLDGHADAPGVAARNYEEMLAAADPVQRDLMAVDEDSLAELFYTSGTSDRPKGVMLSHRNVYLHALNVIAGLQTSPVTAGRLSCQTVELHTIPLFHANGWGAAHGVTVTGGRHVMIHQFDPQQVFRLIERERADSCCLVPTMAVALLNSPHRTQFDLSSLRRIVFGGAMAPPALVQAMERTFGCVCLSGYGLTETAPVLAISPVKAGVEASDEERYLWHARTGYAIPGVELRIVDSRGRDVPRDGSTPGEIVARGDGVMSGYWHNPEGTQAALRGGWFHTGDIAAMDASGYLQIVDRKKDIIVSGGENISSLEIEKTLAAHPCVYEAAVIPVPDAAWGEVPRALVILKPGKQAGEEELLEFCRARLAHFKCPRAIEFVESFPRSGTDKVLKYELRKKYWMATTASS